jgi:hypothetical protein
MSTLARRTSARPVGSGGGRGVVGHNVGTFLQRARSGRGCSAPASAGDRAVAAQGGLASLCRLLGSSPPAVGARGRRCRKAKVVRDDLFPRQRRVSTEPRKPLERDQVKVSFSLRGRRWPPSRRWAISGSMRLIARKQAGLVALWSRHATGLTDRFPRIAEAVRNLPVDDVVLDGEAVVFRPDGHSDFAALRTTRGADVAPFHRVRCPRRRGRRRVRERRAR